jgi:flagella basal body P-ring formation protein FlgA
MMMLLFALAAQVGGHNDRLCEAARGAVLHFAESRGWQADVRCRTPAGTAIPEQASLVAVDPPPVAPLRSGPTAWPVRVLAPGGSTYVQRVPLAISWRAPAWVSRRDLRPGEPVGSDDVALQSTRWPDGAALEPAREQTRPVGRTRQAIRLGDIVTPAQMLPAGALVRGDSITAVLSEGAMEIRMPAQLLAPARVGERARVQVQGRTAALEGRLADAQTLKVDSE